MRTLNIGSLVSLNQSVWFNYDKCTHIVAVRQHQLKRLKVHMCTVYTRCMTKTKYSAHVMHKNAKRLIN